MQKSFRTIVTIIMATFTLVSCFNDNDDDINTNDTSTKDFIWRGLNAYYLYKDEQPDLANNRFTSNQDYNDFLNAYSTPEDLFEHLTVSQDRFSFLVDDYIALEQALSGTSISNGMEFNLYYKPQSSSEVFGIVTYVLPNSDAESKGIERGAMFDKINGNPLYYNSSSDNNFAAFYDDNYTIDLASYDANADTVNSTSESVSLTKSAYTENPVFIKKIIPLGSNNVGYLMYNGFTADFDSQLNDAFGYFLSGGVTDLVLDLRYNPGGSVNTAILLSSMITGQFNGEVFLTRQWNSEIQTYLESDDPESLIDRFKNQLNDGTSINSLNLDKVYILTTEDTASASELVINCLFPYIDVVQVGTNTTGKYQASVTLYDSPDFSRSNANPSHLYAIQPLVFKSLNKNGNTDYDDGLIPNIEIEENFRNFGVLGDENEPLLAAALQDIQANGRFMSSRTQLETPQKVGDSKQQSFLKNKMYIDADKLPAFK